jgi:hypothetical protein
MAIDLIRLGKFMHRQLYAVISIFAFVINGDVHAQRAVIRISCEGPDAGAEVYVNGKFKGECPLDIGVEPGNVQLKVIKPIGDTKERVYEQNFRIGDDVVKTIPVELTTRLNAIGQRLEDERLILETARRRQVEDAESWRRASGAKDSASLQDYLDKYPAGAHVSEAREKLNAIRRPEVAASGNYSRGIIGIQIAALTIEDAKKLGLAGQDGAYVAGISKGRPADSGGVRRGR